MQTSNSYFILLILGFGRRYECIRYKIIHMCHYHNTNKSYVSATCMIVYRGIRCIFLFIYSAPIENNNRGI